MSALVSMMVETGSERGKITRLLLGELLQSSSVNPQSAYDVTNKYFVAFVRSWK